MRWALDGAGLETAGDDWWVAPTAVVIGKVRLDRMRRSGGVPCCAATTS